MSEPIADFTTTVSINDQVIEVSTTVVENMKRVIYQLKSGSEMDPPTVAVALYLMCHDICSRMNIEVDELVDALVDSKESFH
jgi:hypothetical protein